MTNPFDLLEARLSNIETLLLELKHGHVQSNPFPETDKLLTIKQAGELLNLSVPTLYSYVQKAAIPVCKRGKRLYFSEQELREWVKAGRKSTQKETESDADTFLKAKRS